MKLKSTLTATGIVLVSLVSLYLLLGFLIPDDQDYVDNIPPYAMPNAQQNFISPDEESNIIVDVKYTCENDLSKCFSLLRNDPGGLAEISVCGLVVADVISKLDLDDREQFLWAWQGDAQGIQEILDKNPFLVDMSGTAILLRDDENVGYPKGMEKINQQYCVEGLMYLESPNDGWVVVYSFEQSGDCMSFVDEYGHTFPSPEMLRLIKFHCDT